jgi:hypothetical protein
VQTAEGPGIFRRNPAEMREISVQSASDTNRGRQRTATRCKANSSSSVRVDDIFGQHLQQPRTCSTVPFPPKALDRQRPSHLRHRHDRHFGNPTAAPTTSRGVKVTTTAGRRLQAGPPPTVSSSSLNSAFSTRRPRWIPTLRPPPC